MSIIQEFHSDHQKVVLTLFQLRQSIASRNISEVRSLLVDAEPLLGTHFKFEEHFLYPALQRFLGEAYVKRLFNEHDLIFRSIGRLAELAQKPQWTQAEAESAEVNLELIYDHPISCDGLSLWIEQLPKGEQNELDRRLADVRREGTKFSAYRVERQMA